MPATPTWTRRDAVLVFFGTVYGLLAGAGLGANEPPLVPALATGLAFPLVTAAVIRRLRTGRFDEWVAETRRGRDAILAFAAALLVCRSASVWHRRAFKTGSSGGWPAPGPVAPGLGRATHRAVSGRPAGGASEG